MFLHGIGAEKPSYDVAKTVLLTWTPDAINMVSLLKYGDGIGADVNSI
jgi:hypothetical protein